MCSASRLLGVVHLPALNQREVLKGRSWPCMPVSAWLFSKPVGGVRSRNPLGAMVPRFRPGCTGCTVVVAICTSPRPSNGTGFSMPKGCSCRRAAQCRRPWHGGKPRGVHAHAIRRLHVRVAGDRVVMHDRVFRLQSVDAPVLAYPHGRVLVAAVAQVLVFRPRTRQSGWRPRAQGSPLGQPVSGPPGIARDCTTRRVELPVGTGARGHHLRRGGWCGSIYHAVAGHAWPPPELPELSGRRVLPVLLLRQRSRAQLGHAYRTGTAERERTADAP